MSKATHITGSKLLDEHGARIGGVSDVIYADNASAPSWLVVKAGFLRGEHYVPATGSYRTEDDDIVVPFSADQVRSAPKASSDHIVTSELVAELTEHYHLDN